VSLLFERNDIMDTRTGQIYSPEEVQKLKDVMTSESEGSKRASEAFKRMIEMKIPPTQNQLSRKPPKVGRNEPCPCGSGKKFKKCCWMRF